MKNDNDVDALLRLVQAGLMTKTYAKELLNQHFGPLTPGEIFSWLQSNETIESITQTGQIVLKQQYAWLSDTARYDDAMKVLE